MSYLWIKTLHILSATILFGTGLGSAFYLWRAHLTGDARLIAGVARQVVIADWIFTTPTILIQPATGAWLTYHAGYPLQGWLGLSIGLFLFAGLCWLPVVFLQIRMRNDAQQAAQHATPLPPRYWRDARLWFWLGVPAFAAIIGVFYLMVFKQL